jgi:hypothetical protein
MQRSLLKRRVVLCRWGGARGIIFAARQHTKHGSLITYCDFAVDSFFFLTVGFVRSKYLLKDDPALFLPLLFVTPQREAAKISNIRVADKKRTAICQSIFSPRVLQNAAAPQPVAAIESWTPQAKAGQQ